MIIPWGEVENGVRRCSDPLAQISRIRERYTTSNDTSFDLGLSRDVSRTRDNDLVCGTDLTTNLLDLVTNKQSNRLDILPLAPSP